MIEGGTDTTGMLRQIDSAVPRAAVVIYAVTGSTPDGWFVCDGSAKSRTVYSKLFALIGTTYGAGDGTTTYNIPDDTDFVANLNWIIKY